LGGSIKGLTAREVFARNLRRARTHQRRVPGRIGTTSRRVEEAEDAKAGHRIVFFAESARWPENITSASAIGGAGIRFHASAANSVQEQDAIQSFGGQRQLNPAATTVLMWDYASKSAVAGSAPTNHQFGAPVVQDMASWLESYQALGATSDCGNCTGDQLQHLATLGQQAQEFRNKTWLRLACLCRRSGEGSDRPTPRRTLATQIETGSSYWQLKLAARFTSPEV
jgi:uncharacterized protein involved in type VI secretion and phage assembly